MVSLVENSPSRSRLRAGVCWPDDFGVYLELLSDLARRELRLFKDELRELHDTRLRRDIRVDLVELEEEADGVSVGL